MTGEWQPPHTSLLSTQQAPHREASNSHSASPPMPGWAELGLKTEQRVAGRRDSLPPSSARNGWAILVLGVMSSKRSVQILMLGTCECDLVWKWSLCRCETASSGASRQDELTPHPGGLPANDGKRKCWPCRSHTKAAAT